MGDAATTVAELKDIVRRFVDERAWQPFHAPKNLVMGLAVETAELMEHFLWVDGPASFEVAKQPDKREPIADELADVFCHLLNLSIALDMDLSDALRAKMVKNAVKYPADVYRGKYTV
ncbi:MAG: nucleotide pyrophosphohydrolase [Gemmataceae bacterium]|nr:nucleotide pyrophosphohydrolase [Gemmataceae bacterium]